MDNKIDIVINTVTLESNKQRKIQLAVAKRVYESPEFNSTCIYKYGDCEDYSEKEVQYNKKQLSKRLFTNIYRDIKRKFGVASYKDIKVVDYEKALSFIENWIEDREVI